MKAYILTKFGPPEVLQLQEVPRPEPGEKEVLVKVRRIGLNFAEVFMRLGVYPGVMKPPFVPGIESSGIIERVGKGVRGLKKGDRVIAFTKQGAYAEYVCTPVDFVAKIPRHMNLDEAAAITVTYLSALHGLKTLAHLSGGERVLIHAAAGGVGTASLQIARHVGAESFGTVGSDEKRDLAIQHGANHVINYRTEKFADVIMEKTDGYGIDVVMDSVGGSVFRKSWKLLAPMGRYVLFGFAAVTGPRTVPKLKAVSEYLQVPRIMPPSVVSRNVSLMGFNLYFLTHKVDYLRGLMAEIMSLFRRGIVAPVLGARYPFENIPEAHAFLQSRKSVGKVLIDVGD